MSCFFCTKNERDYYYSGGDTSFFDFIQKDLAPVVDSRVEAPYPLYELRKCEVCGGVWFFSYMYPDHPPLVVFGTLLDTKERRKEAHQSMVNNGAEPFRAL